MKKLLVVGAGFLQSFVIKAAKELGIYVLAVDANPYAEGFKYADEFSVINITDSEACLNYAQAQNIDGVLTAATDFGVLTTAYIAKKLQLPGIDYTSAQIIKNKYLVRKHLYEAGADDTGLSFEISNTEDIETVLPQINLPVMVKPCDGSGSRGASRVNNEGEFRSACELAISQSLTHKATVEPFVFGNEYGVESFVLNGKIHILGIMKKLMTKPPYYAELGHSFPSGLTQEVEEKIKGCVTKALSALNVTFGSVNMDLLLTDSGNVHIVDIGARMGGNLIGSHIIPIGTGIEYIKNMILAALGEKADFSVKHTPCPIATRLLALNQGKILQIPDIDKIEKDHNVKIFHHLHIGQIITPYRTNLDGCGYVVACDTTTKNAESTAEQVRTIIDQNIIRKE